MTEGHFHISLGKVTKARVPGFMKINSSLAESQTHADSRFSLHEVDFQPTNPLYSAPPPPPCGFVFGGAGMNFPVGEHEQSLYLSEK